MKKREYGKSRYHNMSEENKQILKEYQKNIETEKSLSIIMKKVLHTLFFSKIILHYQYQIQSRH